MRFGSFEWHRADIGHERKHHSWIWCWLDGSRYAYSRDEHPCPIDHISGVIPNQVGLLVRDIP